MWLQSSNVAPPPAVFSQDYPPSWAVSSTAWNYVSRLSFKGSAKPQTLPVDSAQSIDSNRRTDPEQSDEGVMWQSPEASWQNEAGFGRQIVDAGHMLEPATAPHEEMSGRVHTYLAPEQLSLLSSLRAIILTSAAIARVPVGDLIFSTFTDPEENWTRVTCTVQVGIATEQALAFWDYLGAQIDRWRRGLPSRQSSLVNESFAVYVSWT